MRTVLGYVYILDCVVGNVNVTIGLTLVKTISVSVFIEFHSLHKLNYTF
jgi:hypothetical protein